MNERVFPTRAESQDVFLRASLAAATILVFCLNADATGDGGRSRAQLESAAPVLPADRADAASLRARLEALSPRVRRDEAERVSRCAYGASRELARDYHVVGPPLFHNFLVNIGLKKRGLCFQWTGDLMESLAALQLQTLDLHWGEARARTWREHNCVVVTAKGQPFREGVVLDAWRHSGRLFVGAVAADHYPWQEDVADCLCANRRSRSHESQTAAQRRTSPARTAEASRAMEAVDGFR